MGHLQIGAVEATPPPNPIQMAKAQMNGSQSIEKRLEAQDEELKALRQEIERIKEDYAMGPGNSLGTPKSDGLRSRVLKMEKQLASLSNRLKGKSGWNT